ncbi:MAG: ribosomal L7Ae/L30e/S12e/Gadd45 family protein [Oscillospiraceae bacterium]|nr:ribosomal L7Ae/L30e/S12e/Gadd45 family protein [Oscillospiraceae bacterium]
MLENLLGLCKRAGRLAVGFDAVTALLHKNATRLVLLAADASPKTQKEIQFHAQQAAHLTPVHTVPLTKEQFARAVGSAKPVAVAAVTDDGFAARIIKEINKAAVL